MNLEADWVFPKCLFFNPGLYIETNDDYIFLKRDIALCQFFEW